ncbi:hypothetical protein ABI59_14465 [Acidobacteria bacterium Mor1]|nr:hypothetical protein ABI59_14465 [Acidobacteria bacterium Mor1]
MNPTGDSTSMLTNAFQRFERAAHRLEEKHSSLHAKVDRLERELLDANRRLETVLDALDVALAVLQPDGSLLRVNAAFEQLGLGSAGDTLTDPDLRELLDKTDAEAQTARLRRESPFGTRDFAVTFIPVDDEIGTRVLTVQDVTEIRKEEAEGGRRQRLEALGRMAAELAHEVRNPLGSIRLFASMLGDDLADRPAEQEMAERILSATSGLEGTVSNLLAFANPSEGVWQTIDLREIAEDVCGLLAPACSLRGVALTSPDRRGPCWVEGDGEGMRQVLLNLVGNALSATGDGGKIVVDVVREGSEARLTVEDDGCGIAAEDLPRVFDPFFSRTENGTGLGLSIVHGIVERGGGQITLHSRKEEGTRAVVSLPVRPAQPEVLHG